MSQTPFHNPAKEPLPKFADQWFKRYDRGDDVRSLVLDSTNVTAPSTWGLRVSKAQRGKM